MAFAIGTKGGGVAEINVTPMIDVLLVLLIIFMVIQPSLQRGLESSVPQPPKDKRTQVSPPSTLVVEVLTARTGGAPVLRLNQQAYPTGAALEQALAAALATRQDRAVFVHADRGLEFAAVAQAVGWSRQAGAEQIALLCDRDLQN